MIKRLLLFIEQPSIAWQLICTSVGFIPYACTIFTFLSRPVKWKPSRRVHQPSHILPKKKEERIHNPVKQPYLPTLYALIVILCKNCERKSVGRLLFRNLFPHLCSYFACRIIWCRCHARSVFVLSLALLTHQVFVPTTTTTMKTTAAAATSCITLHSLTKWISMWMSLSMPCDTHTHTARGRTKDGDGTNVCLGWNEKSIGQVWMSVFFFLPRMSFSWKKKIV